MSTLKDLNKKIVLTQAQFNARQAAGTLVEGVEYEISDALAGVEDVKVNNTSVVSNGVANITIPAETYTSSEQAKVTAAYNAVHSHSNKSTLDTIDSTKVASWDGKSVVTGTGDGTNWTSLTVNGNTLAIPNPSLSAYRTSADQDVIDGLQDTAINAKLDASKCTLQTTAPTAAITDGGVHIVYLTSEPATKYDGYIYLIKE